MPAPVVASLVFDAHFPLIDADCRSVVFSVRRRAAPSPADMSRDANLIRKTLARLAGRCVFASRPVIRIYGIRIRDYQHFPTSRGRERLYRHIPIFSLAGIVRLT